MKTKKWRFDRGNLPFALLLVMILIAAPGCERDLLEDQAPGWLGESIYTNLKNGRDGRTYNNMVRLIDDLNYKEVLAKTGSKTLFIANDDAFDTFYKSNDWGATKYEDLTYAQKKMLLYGAMLNNSYPLSMLSSTSGPVYGNCMRRLTSLNVYDSVPLMLTSEMPDTKYWKWYKNNNRSIVCMKDMTAAPIIQYLEKQLTVNSITNDDVAFLMNQSTPRQSGDAAINAIPVTEKDIKCSNGFVHELGRVMTPLTNMAELIRQRPNTKMFSRLLERYSAPVYTSAGTSEYNRLYANDVDSLFQKKYFSSYSNGGSYMRTTDDADLLRFDPGWNGYYLSPSTLQQDMAVMLVPTDEAMTSFFESGVGESLKDSYTSGLTLTPGDYSWLDLIPNSIVLELLNNNMFYSFKAAVPSKFETMLDASSYELGLTTAAVDSVLLACNGAVYLTNQVFSPSSYTSVAFPAMADQNTMSIIWWIIKDKRYDSYLNAKEEGIYYSFFIPDNNALQHYIDPVSYGRQTQLYKFYYDAKDLIVKASIWNYDIPTGQIIGTDSTIATSDQVRNRLFDILETHTVIGDIRSGNEYYRTKGGSTIRVSGSDTEMEVAGSLQIDSSEFLTVSKIYNQGNGKTYILHDEPIMTTRKSVIDILEGNDKFEEYAKLLDGSGYLVPQQNSHSNANDRNIGFLSKYHYTVYVPTNESIKQLMTAGKLASWEDVDSLYAMGIASDSLKADAFTSKNREFVKYHIQDNSIFVDKLAITQSDYETALLNASTKIFRTVKVSGGSDALTVEDQMGNVRHVVTTTGLYNQIAREYEYDSSDNASAGSLHLTSELVVHQIDGPLMFE
jgi:uncharacterized surface protein with fasciclin (FAS1) repeats